MFTQKSETEADQVTDRQGDICTVGNGVEAEDNASSSPPSAPRPLADATSKESPEQLSISQIQQQMGFDETPDWQASLTPIQRLGASLTFTILALVVFTTAFVGFQLYHSMPAPPDLTGPDAKDRLDNYIALRHVVMDEATKTYSLLITTSLLPLLTGLIGALIGSHMKPPKS